VDRFSDGRLPVPLTLKIKNATVSAGQPTTAHAPIRHRVIDLSAFEDRSVVRR
jgi:hypothetical protein